jgi:hypothetical protein
MPPVEDRRETPAAGGKEEMAVAGGHGVLRNDDLPERSRRHALSQSTREIPRDLDQMWMPPQPGSERGDSMSERLREDDE